MHSWTRIIIIAGLTFIVIKPPTSAQVENPTRSKDGVWEFIDGVPPELAAAEMRVQPDPCRIVHVTDSTLVKLLKRTPREVTGAARAKPTVLTLPMPDGTFARFAIVESPIMHPELAARFPQIKTYVGRGIDYPGAAGRLSYTPHGFHAQILSPDGAVYIDPLTKADPTVCASYYKRDFRALGKTFQCIVEEVIPLAKPEGPRLLQRSGDVLRTYRVAVAANGEYTQFHGGTAADGLAAIVTTMNRVIGIYEVELAIRMELVADNDQIVYTNPATDPYDPAGDLLGQNQTNIDAVIGNSNYDIGHLFTVGAGGVAGLGVVCDPTSKAIGLTGSDSPVGDPFDIDYVAHEIGHQFGAQHTFNGTIGSCSGNHNATTAYEPGSGSTILGYAGICGGDDLQLRSDPYFHSISLEEILGFVTNGTTGGSCPVLTATGNGIPTVDAGADFTIPLSTPFALTATATDPDSDSLTYCWEQFDLGPQALLTAPDDGEIPIFRSFPPVPMPTRTFPQLTDLLNNTTPVGERLPVVARTMVFRVTARDNRVGGGGVDGDDMVVTVDGGSGPFRVTSPNTAVALIGAQIVSWDVAGTSGPPVNAANVNILLSTDGGFTFPTTLAANTPNDGSQQVALPPLMTTTARIRVEAAGNIFFDVSDANFSIVTGIAATGNNTVDDTPGNGNSNGMFDPGESTVRLLFEILNATGGSLNGVTGALSSATPTATVICGESTYPDLAPDATAMNSLAFIVALDVGHNCGDPVNLQLVIDSDQEMATLNFSLPTTTVPGPYVNFSYDAFGGGDPVVPILDDNLTGVDIPITVSGLANPITDLDFSIDGTSCNANVLATTNGINHTYVGDLIMTLQSPTGTTITLMSNPGPAPDDSDGNNFCNTVFNDEGGGPAIDTITGAGEPYTGTFTPTQPLSAFDGLNGNGTWTINVVDNFFADSGDVRAMTLRISTVVCQAPGAVTSEVSVAGTTPTVEGSTNGEFTVTLDNPVATDVNVRLKIAGSATPGVDYDVLAETVLIPANETTVAIPVNALFDCDVEGIETITLTLTVTDQPGVAISATNGDATMPVQPEEVPPSITCPPDQTIGCDTAPNPIDTGSATATDSCGPVTTAFSDSLAAGTAPELTIVTRTWEATDVENNTATCDQTITVVISFCAQIYAAFMELYCTELASGTKQSINSALALLTPLTDQLFDGVTICPDGQPENNDNAACAASIAQSIQNILATFPER